MQPQQQISRHAILLFTDVVGSTDLKQRHGTAAYARMLRRHNSLFEGFCKQFAGTEIIKHTGDGYFATFATASDAVTFALLFQAAMRAEPWQPEELQTRVGIHAGEVAMMTMIGKADVIGLAADLAARVMSLGEGGQILLTRAVFDDARQFVEGHPASGNEEPPKIRWMAHGPYLFKGSSQPAEIYEVGAEGLAPLIAPTDTEKSKRVVSTEAKPHLGWRPALGQTVPNRPDWRLSRQVRTDAVEEIWIGSHKATGEKRSFRFIFDDAKSRTIKDILTVATSTPDTTDPVLDSQLDQAPVFVAKGVMQPISSEPAHPDFIGPYRIVGVLGSGGMGIVYKAEQREPIRRIVAVKVIKAGMDTNEVIARFESERQALAMMEHPCIARVLDAGATSLGRPYFVMEYVGGERITDYCDRQNLSITQRLELFAQVCDAVQHAHTKAVIHRDLKPSNILVQLIDNTPVPKIIDFGIAKATNQRLTEKTLFTDLGQLIGTPEYMSPEQAEMSGAGVDTRSDIYSLGVVLYELMVGALPFDPKTLRAAAYGEIQRIIREVEPPRMSTRLSSLGEKATEIARHRRAAPAALQSEIRGELEWIPQKAMRKDRTERYEHAGDLARDVRNYLAQQPLIAGPESAAYKLRKFVRRNRARVLGAAVAASIVLATAVVAFILITQQRNEARRARDDAERARIAETAAREQAETNYRAARNAVFDFYTSVSQNELLKYEPLRPIRLQLLQRASEYFRGFVTQASNAAGRRSDLAQSLNVLGDASRELGQQAESIESLRKSIELRKSLVAEKPQDASRQIDLAAATMNLGRTFEAQGKLKEAIAQYTAAEAMLAPHLSTIVEAKSQAAQAHHNIAVDNHYLKQRDIAAAEYRTAIDLRRQLSAADPSSSRFTAELAQSLNALAKLIEPDQKPAAMALLAESTELRERLWQRQPDATAELRTLAESLGWLATLQFQLGDPAAAATNRRAAERWSILLDSPQHLGQPSAAFEGYSALCWSHLLAGAGAPAEESARRGLRLRSDDELLQINLAHALLAQSKDAEARTMYQQFRGRTIEDIPVADYLKLDLDALRAAGALDAGRVVMVLEWMRQ